MSKYKYTYKFSEETTDLRYYTVQSNKKLTRSEREDPDSLEQIKQDRETKA